MLQYLINDVLPGFNLPSLSLIEGGNWVLDVSTSEIRSQSQEWDRCLLFDGRGMISLKRNRRGLLWILFDDLTHRSIGDRYKVSLTCEEAVRTYLR
jgi:hypothetical protein